MEPNDEIAGYFVHHFHGFGDVGVDRCFVPKYNCFEGVSYPATCVEVSLVFEGGTIFCC